MYVCKWFPSVTFAVFVEGKHLHIYISYAFCPKPYLAPTLQQFWIFAKSHLASESYSPSFFNNFPFQLTFSLCNELIKYWKSAQYKQNMTGVRAKCNMYATPVFCASDGKFQLKSSVKGTTLCVDTKMQNMKSIEYLWHRYSLQDWKGVWKLKIFSKLNIF